MIENQAVSISTEPVSMAEMKKLYPGEWVLIGNPVMDEGFFHVLSGIPVYHSRDKREVAYLGRDKVAGFQTFTLVLIKTGEPVRKPVRKLVSLYSRLKK